MKLSFLDHVNLGRIWLQTAIGEYRRWKAAPGNRKRTPRVFYGYDAIPGKGEHVFGGLVKLQELQEKIPNHPIAPNMLYLVSSALPYFPVRMARWAKLAGAKLVINQNGVAYPAWYGRGWERVNRPMRQLHEMADHVFYQSRFCKMSADKFLNVTTNNNDILYNCVDTKYFSPAGPSKSSNARIMLLTAGSHWSFYRPRIAIDVLQRVRRVNNRVHLKIAGRFCWEKNPGRAVQQVKSYAASLGVADAVEFTGPYTQQEALKLFHSCSILLHTKYNDPCPRLVIEAMACGLPVVYSSTGGVPELVRKSAGVGVPGKLDWEQDHPPDADALAEAVLKVMAKIDVYALAARKRAVEKFDVRPWLQRHRELFEELFRS